MQYEWNFTAGRASRVEVIHLDSGTKRVLDRDLSRLFEEKVLPLANTLLRGPGESIFRDIEYRLARDIFLARLWEVQGERQ